MEHAPKERGRQSQACQLTISKFRTLVKPFHLLQVIGRQIYNGNVTILQWKEISGREKVPTTCKYIILTSVVSQGCGLTVEIHSSRLNILFPFTWHSFRVKHYTHSLFPIANVCAAFSSALSAVHQLGNQSHIECLQSEMLDFASDFLAGCTLIHLLLGDPTGTIAREVWSYARKVLCERNFD